MGFFSKISDKSKYDVRIVLSLLFTEIKGLFNFKGKSIFLTILNAIFNIISFFFSLICKCISIFCVFFNSRFFHKNIFCNEIWCHFFKKFLLVILNFFSKNTFKSYTSKNNKLCFLLIRSFKILTFQTFPRIANFDSKNPFCKRV